MSRGGWIIHNMNLLEELIRLAFIDLKNYYVAGYNYVDRRKTNIEAWYKVRAMEMLEKDPTLTGPAITSKCESLCNAAHQHMMEHRAKAMMMDPSIRFPEFWAAISDRPYQRRSPDRSTCSGPLSAL